MEQLKPDSVELQSLLNSLMHPELKVIDLSLDRMRNYMNAIGNPQNSVPPIIHVAGTNGKGSTIAFMRAALEKAGYICHVYTSPHLISFRERIVIAGQPVAEPELLEVLRDIQNVQKELPLTFFEATTAAAFRLFAQTPADVVLLEVGMGGQFDATNIITPIASVITPVSMDHQRFLGNTVAKIAYEKACIIKPNVAVVVAKQSPDAMEVIEAKAAELEAAVTFVATEYFDGLGLAGKHQHENAATAKAVLNALNMHFDISNEVMLAAFASTKWAARLQEIEYGLGENWLGFVDGGHNASAGEALADWINKLEGPVHIICAMAQGKNHKEFLAPFIKKVETFSVVEIPDEPLTEPLEGILAVAESFRGDVNAYNTIDAVLHALKERYDGGVLLCCGSLYFAGKLLEKFPSSRKYAIAT